MRLLSSLPVAASALALLSACSGTPPAKSTAAARPAPVRAPVRSPAQRAPGPVRVQSIPGLEGLIGASAPDLVRQFGQPRIDVIEGDARKLQFTGTACVLDVYLYPLAKDAEPTAAYVDARRASDGQDVDRVACVAALLRR